MERARETFPSAKNPTGSEPVDWLSQWMDLGMGVEDCKGRSNDFCEDFLAFIGCRAGLKPSSSMVLIGPFGINILR